MRHLCPCRMGVSASRVSSCGAPTVSRVNPGRAHTCVAAKAGAGLMKIATETKFTSSLPARTPAMGELLVLVHALRLKCRCCFLKAIP